MHDENDPIAALRHLLAVHRRTIEFLEVQRAYFGAFAPPYLWHQFDETRGEIARIKGELCALGALVEDQVGDSAASTDHPGYGHHATDGDALLLVYQRMLVDQVRYLSLPGPSAWGDLHLQLADLYVERALMPLAPLQAMGAGVLPTREQTIALRDLVRAPGARVLLEGDSGSGKTTCLQMIALACAARATGEPASGARLVADWPDPIPLPILLNAREIAAALTNADAAPEGSHLPGPSAFWAAIERWLQYSDLEALVPTIQLRLERGDCLILIDDLDDFPAEPDQHAYLVALGRFVSRYPDNRYLMTWRALAAGVVAGLASFARYRLAPLDQGRMDAMIAHWYSAIGDRTNILMSEELSERIARLQGVLHGDERLCELAGNPRGLALCVLAHAEGHALPAERAVVLRRLAHELLAGWEWAGADDARGEDSPGAAERWLAVLEPLAFAFQQRTEPGSDQPLALSYAEIKSYLSENQSMASIERRRVGTDIIAELVRRCCRGGLLVPSGPAAYTMPHRLLREYLAARALAQLPDFPARAYALRDDPGWREPLLLAAHNTGRGRATHSVPAFVCMLLQAPEYSHGKSQRSLLLAAECLLELGEWSPAERTVSVSVRERLADLMTAPAYPIEQRVQAGLLLGRLGDTHCDGLPPPLAQVPAGPCILGADDGYADEGPPQWVDVPAFAIGVYPVTNCVYSMFLAENLAHPRPSYWYDPRFNNPTCPVVGVTWHDAMAYCAWLSARLARFGLLPQGLVVRLPREVEWEKAASWDERRQAKRRYPWGDEWNSALANTADGRGAWYTAPVGCYPDSVSSYGLHDCIGNVWEWMTDEYASYPGAAQPFHEAGRYTLRGSSCASNATHARCTYRSRLPPDAWRYHLGFRIVVGQPIA
ncbi:MAG: SUMF1/EgtB/PvdO family nonheme iron enzyme [Roseiflexaceae bacterium]